MNIVYCTDNQFLQIEISILSIIEHTSTKCVFFILTKDISKEQELRFNRLSEYYDCKINIVLVDESLLPFLKYINDENGLHPGMGKLLPSAAYYRWLIPYYLHNEDRCLYLDTDVIANRDLNEIYNFSLENSSIYGIANGSRKDEIISGVILINIKYWNDNDLLDKLNKQTMKSFQENDRINDQYILNVVTRDNQIVTTDESFSCGSGQIMTQDDLSKYYTLHYCGTYRPWELKGGRIWKNTEYWWKYYDKINYF